MAKGVLGIWLILALALSAGLSQGPSAHAAQLAGVPPHARLSPDPDVFPQNMALTQDTEGHLYVGNAGGVLFFDGARWELIDITGGDPADNPLVRSLDNDASGRVYVGGYDHLGYIEHDATARPRYQDLRPLIPEPIREAGFADVWMTLVTPEGVYFQAVKHLFHYRPEDDSISVWQREDRYGAMVWHRGELWIQHRGEGLVRWAEGAFLPIPGTDSLTELIYDMVPMADEGLLLFTTDGEWVIHRGDRLEPAGFPEDLPPSTQFDYAERLVDGSVAMGNVGGWIYIVAPDGASYVRFQLSPDRIGGLSLDRFGGLLMVTDLEIIHVDWPTPWMVQAAEAGLASSIYNVRSWQGGVHALTTAGVFRDGDGNGHYDPTDWTAFEAWDLAPLDEQTALLAESYVVSLIDEDGATSLTHRTFYPRVLLQERSDPNVFHIGTELGFAVLQRQGDQWRLAHNQDDEDSLINSLAQIAPREVWLGAVWGPLRRVRYDAGYQVVESTTFGDESGLSYGPSYGAALALLDDRLVVSTETGLFAWNGSRFENFGGESLAGVRQPDEWLFNLVQDEDGGIWAISARRVLHRSPAGDWALIDTGGVLRGVLLSLGLVDGQPWFGATNSIIRYTGIAGADPPQPQARLRAVSVTSEVGQTRFLDHGSAAVLGPGESSIRFQFALTDYRRPEAVRFRARLDGLESQWSDWETLSAYTYSGLEPGDYRFEVEARDSSGRVTPTQPLALTVVPPWYASSTAQLAWIGLLVLAVSSATYGLQRIRLRRLEANNIELERMVRERTRELESANQRLDAMAHLDGLTGIANRRRLGEYLEAMWAHCRSKDRPLALMMVDVDHFKRFNDEQGHLAGDQLLRQLTRELSACLRRGEDLVARYGGEEFVVVLPGADAETAFSLAERMRAQVEAARIGATVSIGVAASRLNGDSHPEALIQQADTGLYQAKSAGRNRVVLASEDPQRPDPPG